ncbi:MAG: site-specific integrase [Candidatus Thiodiazotropha lotti]|nr:site-specific integrase [Candidatus Thiodiazotropha lotti]MCG8002803.1 site-specific integrase [Candidatus Thiodiazotropha lotti]MCG8007149.1 site-specific integrase [Candidatus Thiodiazotropha lotti]MCW4186423.1 site-specific integrase [Candidatus Thiodiazotropha lotti]MCW4194730.1 site-specific integrase [Candidatus Thiodiazotropha lotti]
MDNIAKVKSLSVSNISKSISFNGYEFDIESDLWALNRNKELNVDFITEFDPSIQEDIRSTLVYFAESKSGDHAYNVCNAIKNYYAKTGRRVIDESGLLAYKSIYSKKSEEYRLGLLRVFLKQLYFLEFKAVSDQVFELLSSWKLSGNDKGTAVLSLDPEEGPYSDIEFEAIKNGLDNKYAEAVINAEEYSLAQLFAATGRRPIQIASLKIGDLRIDSYTLETPVFMVRIPKAKVRGSSFRSKFTDFALIESIGQVLSLYIEEVKKEAESQIGRKLKKDEADMLPMFPSHLRQLKKLTQEEVKSVLTTDVTHRKTSDVTSKLRDIFDKLGITSERTGRPIKTTGYRFRYTLGTRAAREGAGVLTIATLLDHSDTQNTKVYVANIPEHAATISEIMNGSLMRYASAFQGEVVESEDSVLSSVPGAQRIRTSDSSDNVGSCGTNAMCHDYAPVACYTCPKFKAWRDAPHHLVLKWLLDERERIVVETNDLEIAAINDRAIYAVTQVMKRCNELREDAAYG